MERHRDQISRSSRFCNHALIFSSLLPILNWVLLSIHHLSSNDILKKNIHKIRIRGSDLPKSALTLYEQDIELHNSYSHIQKLKTMMKRSLHQTIKVLKFWDQTWKIRTWSTNEKTKENQSTLKGSKESTINRTYKDSTQKETLVISVTMRINFENQRAHPLLSQTRRQKTMGKFFEKNLSESVWEEISKTVQRLHQWETHEPLVDSWHPPCVRSTKRNRAANSMKKCSFVHREAYCQSNKRPKKIVEKILLSYWRISDNKITSSRTWSRRNLVRFYGRTQNPCILSAALHYITSHENSTK